MTPNQMVALITQRTKIASRTKIFAELDSAFRWVVRRVYNSADGPDLLTTVGDELPALVAVTKTLDIAAQVTGVLIGIKKLWVKLPADTVFVSMVPADINEPEYIEADAFTAENPEIAAGHPVLYDILNFSIARFAPSLPIGAVIRVDYFRMGPAPGVPESGETSASEDNEDWEAGKDLPSIFHDAIVSKATAQLFSMLDDARETTWELRAKDELNDAIYMGRRVQFPVSTQPFRARRRRYI